MLLLALVFQNLAMFQCALTIGLVSVCIDYRTTRTGLAPAIKWYAKLLKGFTLKLCLICSHIIVIVVSVKFRIVKLRTTSKVDYAYSLFIGSYLGSMAFDAN